MAREQPICTGAVLVRSGVLGAEAPVNMANAHFFLVLLTLHVTPFDRYRQVYVMRYGSGGRFCWI